MERFIAAGVTLAITFAAVAVVNRLVGPIVRRKKGLHLSFLQSLGNALILVIGIYAALSQFEVAREVSRTILQSGSLIIAVATFAAQQALGNIISGFAISATKPCDIGQKIRVQSGGSTIAEGIVRDMTLRHVVIEQYDGNTCIVPNSVIDGAVIINTNYLEHVGNFLEFEIAYDADIERAKKIITEICRREPLLLHTDDLTIYVSRLTANGVVLKFTAWSKDLNDSFTACSHVRQKVVEAFQREGIVIPYQTVTLEKGETFGKEEMPAESGILRQEEEQHGNS